ncbi:MAG: murein biosynthesis integral membrane protein MurJ [Gammaproteobacteria bacterium]
MSRKLLHSTAIVGAMTMISRVLGLVRDRVIAQYFGAGVGADAFFVAFKIPNFLRRLFAEGAFSQAFVPILSEYRSQKSHDETRSLINNVAGTLGLVVTIITILGVLGAPVLITIFAPGFLDNSEKFDLTVSLLRVTFPYILFISLTALAAGVLNTYKHFAGPALTPVFLNLSIIGASIWLAPMLDQPITALAWGVFIGGVIQLLFQFPFLRKLRLIPRPSFKRKDEGVRRILKLMGPAIFGVSVSQINLLFDTLIASFLITGSVSWLYYADRMLEFPLGVFGIALGVVILPNLSEKHAQGSTESFSKILDWAFRWVLIIGFPAMLGLALLAEPILCTLFQYGEFSEQDVALSSKALVAYSFGLLGFILIKVLAPGYYSRQDTKTPVRIGIIAMVSNMILNVIFVFPLAHAGLALATSISAFINAGLLYRGLRKQGVYQPESGWMTVLIKVGIAGSLMTLALLFYVPELSQWSQWTGLQRAAQLGKWISIGGAIYAGTLFLLGVRWRDLNLST